MRLRAGDTKAGPSAAIVSLHEKSLLGGVGFVFCYVCFPVGRVGLVDGGRSVEFRPLIPNWGHYGRRFG